MPFQLLPASAQAFAPRAPPTIVLNTKVEPWLTQTLKRVNKIKRPLNSVPQHFRCLTDILGGEAALWTLASLVLPKAPDADLRKDSNPLIEALFNYQLVHIDAYIVHIDMVSQHEVAFKLTSDTIELLIDYHKHIYSADASASTWTWPEKEVQLKKMQEDFVQAANKFVFRTGIRALEGLEEDGTGELLDGRSEDVKMAILHMFVPLLPPPPRMVDAFHPATNILTNPTLEGNWWAAPSLAPPLPAHVDSWRLLPSTPSPTTTSCSESQANLFWHDMSLGVVQLPSPTPSFSQPLTFASAPSQFYSSPQCMAEMPALSMPSPMPLHCGTDFAMSGFNDFSWSAGGFVPQYATMV